MHIDHISIDDSVNNGTTDSQGLSCKGNFDSAF